MNRRLILILIPLILLATAYAHITAYPRAYWIWAGITAKDAPAGYPLYFYQGLIATSDGHSRYTHIGLYPHPVKAPAIFLVYRLQGSLPDPAMVARLFIHQAETWQHHPLTITGLQLDFDSPTSQLLAYSDFLQQLRAQLPKPYTLSITGLGDWLVSGDRATMEAINSHTDELVIQLYQGRKPLPDTAHYIEKLRHYPLPFKIGLLVGSRNLWYISRLELNPNFKGVMYFIQKN